MNRDETLFSFFLFFFTRGGCASRLRACLGARLLLQSYQYPNLSEGADRVGGQLRGDKRVSLQWRNQIGRVWRKVSESNARSVRSRVSFGWTHMYASPRSASSQSVPGFGLYQWSRRRLYGRPCDGWACSARSRGSGEGACRGSIPRRCILSR